MEYFYFLGGTLESGVMCQLCKSVSDFQWVQDGGLREISDIQDLEERANGRVLRDLSQQLKMVGKSVSKLFPSRKLDINMMMEGVSCKVRS